MCRRAGRQRKQGDTRRKKRGPGDSNGKGHGKGCDLMIQPASSEDTRRGGGSGAAAQAHAPGVGGARDDGDREQDVFFYIMLENALQQHYSPNGYSPVDAELARYAQEKHPCLDGSGGDEGAAGPRDGVRDAGVGAVDVDHVDAGAGAGDAERERSYDFQRPLRRSSVPRTSTPTSSGSIELAGSGAESNPRRASPPLQSCDHNNCSATTRPDAEHGTGGVQPPPCATAKAAVLDFDASEVLGDCRTSQPLKVLPPLTPPRMPTKMAPRDHTECTEDDWTEVLAEMGALRIAEEEGGLAMHQLMRNRCIGHGHACRMHGRVACTWVVVRR